MNEGMTLRTGRVGSWGCTLSFDSLIPTPHVMAGELFSALRLSFLGCEMGEIVFAAPSSQCQVIMSSTRLSSQSSAREFSLRCYHPCFLDGETEAQRGEASCPGYMAGQDGVKVRT
jgi:hypothetical protein